AALGSGARSTRAALGSRARSIRAALASWARSTRAAPGSRAEGRSGHRSLALEFEFLRDLDRLLNQMRPIDSVDGIGEARPGSERNIGMIGHPRLPEPFRRYLKSDHHFSGEIGLGLRPFLEASLHVLVERL